MLSRISDLKLKEVINLNDGKRLGFIEDVELDLETGQIKAIIVPGKSGFWMFKSDNIVIPWEQVHRLGADVILVNLPVSTKDSTNIYLGEPYNTSYK